MSYAKAFIEHVQPAGQLVPDFHAVIEAQDTEVMRLGPFPTELGARSAMGVMVNAFMLGFEHGAKQPVAMSALTARPLERVGPVSAIQPLA